MPRPGRSHPHPDLFAGLVSESPAVPPQAPSKPLSQASPDTPSMPETRRSTPVWVAVYLPSLALQAVQSQIDPDRSVVVINDAKPTTIVATNKAAYRRGIFVGQVLRSAMALDASLQIVERQPAAEQALLTETAHRFLAFSSRVSLQPPQTVLLDVRASLRLFGGVDALLQRLSAGLRQHGLFFRYSVASTARAAGWLARAGYETDAEAVVSCGHDNPEMQKALHSLDINVTGWPPAHLQALGQMGVRTLADCRRLPRSGLLRRFGPDLLTTLGQAFGELPEARECIDEPQRFESVGQLDAEISDASRLQTGCEQLLAQLERFLRERQAMTRELRFVFHAWRGTAGKLCLRPGFPGYLQAHWQGLLSVHLERCLLEQPAVAISLCADASEPLQTDSHELALSPDETAAAPVDMQATHEFLDRLRTRLGEESVSALQYVDSHCPSAATRLVPPLSDTQWQASPPEQWQLRSVPNDLHDDHRAGCDDLHRNISLQRPLWLLEQPQPVHMGDDGRLFCQGPLTLTSGPERIAPVWWSGSDAVRDYFVATTQAGARLWVFRRYGSDASQVSWWLHGVFG